MSVLPEVVITGQGVVSPIGVGLDAFWGALLAGKSGVGPLDFPGAEEMPVKIGAPVRNFEAKEYITPRKSLKVMCEEIQFGFAAAVMSMQQAGLASGSFDPDRCGVLFGSEMFYCPIEDMEGVYAHCLQSGQFEYNVWGEKGMADLYPLWMLKYLPNMTACHIAIGQDARGPNNTICLGEASALLALIESVNAIERGLADIMLCGASGSRLSLTPWMYRGGLLQSQRHDDPTAASRPFDAERDGQVNGEGGACFVLESRAHAEARGARPLARVLGYGRSFGHYLGSLEGRQRAVELALRQALEQAGVTRGDVGHVNAHGLSTVESDRLEARAIAAVLADTPVTALKSYFGSLGAAGGAVEMVASVLAFEHELIPATLNYDKPDPECPVHVVHGAPIAERRRLAVLLNISGTGQVAAVVLAGG